MTKEIVKVEGCDGYFCDVVFVTGLYINGVRRVEFPRHIYWLLRPIRQYAADTQRIKKYTKEISVLMMNIGNLYNCVDEMYGCLRCGALTLPREFKDDFSMMMEGYWHEDEKLRYLPEKFVSEERYTPNINETVEVYFSIIRLKPQGISYLKQKFGEDRKFGKLICVMEMMGKHTEEGIDFNRYINKWAKCLLREVTEFAIKEGQNENPKPEGT